MLDLRGIDMQEADALCAYFFTGIAAARYPQTIEAVTAEVGIWVNATGVTFPGGLDESDLQDRAAVPAGAVEIYLHHAGST